MFGKKKQMIFKIYKGNLFLTHFLFLNNWIADVRMDTKIGQIDLCHILMKYASFDIKSHIMTNDAYDMILLFFANPIKIFSGKE